MASALRYKTCTKITCLVSMLYVFLPLHWWFYATSDCLDSSRPVPGSRAGLLLFRLFALIHSSLLTVAPRIVRNQGIERSHRRAGGKNGAEGQHRQEMPSRPRAGRGQAHGNPQDVVGTQMMGLRGVRSRGGCQSHDAGCGAPRAAGGGCTDAEPARKPASGKTGGGQSPGLAVEPAPAALGRTAWLILAR